MVWKGFPYSLSHPYGNPLLKGVPANIQLDYLPRILRNMRLEANFILKISILIERR